MIFGFGFPNLLSLYFGVLIIVVVCKLHPNLWALSFELYSFDQLLCFVIAVCTIDQALDFGVSIDCCVSSLLCAHYILGYGF